MAMGSVSELEYELLLAHDLGYVNDQDYLAIEPNVQEVKQMLTGLMKKLKADR
jgi:four helix bundle protein